MKMNKKKEIISIIIVVLNVFFLMGCVSRSGIVNNQKRANESLPTIRYKSDVDAPFGQMAAIYENSLYYCDKKDLGTGIYKYDLSSGKEEFIIEVENIRKIQITEEGIYYIGRTPENDIETKDLNAEWNTYQLFFHEGHEKKEGEDQLFTASIRAWDFFASDAGVFFVEIENPVPNGQPVLRKYLIGNNGVYMKWHEVEVIVERVTENVSIAEFANLTLGSLFAIDEEREKQITRIASVHNRQSDEIVYVVSDRILYEAYYCYVFFTSYNEGYLCSEDNHIFLVDEQGIHKQTTIEAIEKFKFGFKQENHIYLIGDFENQESLYVLNMDTFDVEIIQELDDEEKVVAMTDKGFICATPQEVILRDIQSGEKIKSQSWDEEINWDKNTVEVAGDYIFVYEYEEGITIKEKRKW